MDFLHSRRGRQASSARLTAQASFFSRTPPTVVLASLVVVTLSACSEDGSNDTTANLNGIGDNVQVTDTDVVESPGNGVLSIGDVQTLEVQGVVLSSLPTVAIDRDAPAVQLGRALFWDPVLSGDRDTACATCHLPEFGYADGRARSVGTGGVGSGPTRVAGAVGQVPRNAQTVLNTRFNGITEFGVVEPENAPMFWDNRTRSLAAQALEPILSREELRGDSFSEDEILDEVVARLEANADYVQMFDEAFGSTTITPERLGQALAEFQSTLIANNAPFDRWMRGDATAMTPQQLNGMNIFAETGCAECHSGPMFSDFETHVLGVPEAPGLAVPDAGDGRFGFRTPSLRQLAFTAPYFHGGQDQQLDDVIDFYDNPNGSDNPNVAANQLDPAFRGLPNINNAESNAIEAFLDALNDADFDRSRPASVPSGLPVGGSL